MILFTEAKVRKRGRRAKTVQRTAPFLQPANVQPDFRLKRKGLKPKFEPLSDKTIHSERAVPHARRGGEGSDERGEGSDGRFHQPVLKPSGNLDLHNPSILQSLNSSILQLS